MMITKAHSASFAPTIEEKILNEKDFTEMAESILAKLRQEANLTLVELSASDKAIATDLAEKFGAIKSWIVEDTDVLLPYSTVAGNLEEYVNCRLKDEEFTPFFLNKSSYTNVEGHQSALQYLLINTIADIVRRARRDINYNHSSTSLAETKPLAILLFGLHALIKGKLQRNTSLVNITDETTHGSADLVFLHAR